MPLARSDDALDGSDSVCYELWSLILSFVESVEHDFAIRPGIPVS